MQNVNYAACNSQPMHFNFRSLNSCKNILDDGITCLCVVVVAVIPFHIRPSSLCLSWLPSLYSHSYHFPAFRKILRKLILQNKWRKFPSNTTGLLRMEWQHVSNLLGHIQAFTMNHPTKNLRTFLGSQAMFTNTIGIGNIYTYCL